MNQVGVQIRRAGLALMPPLRVAFLSIVGALFVGAAAFLISVIQFQIRVIEAKNQSNGFSFNVLTQSVRLQNSLVDAVELVQSSEKELAGFEDFHSKYFTQLIQYAGYVCSTLQQKQDDCVVGLSRALFYGAAAPSVVQSAVEKNTQLPTESFSKNIKEIIDQTAEIGKARYQYAQDHGAKILEVRSACFIIETVMKVSEDKTPAAGVLSAQMMNGQPPQQNEFQASPKLMLSFSKEYVQAARIRCVPQFGLGFSSATTVEQKLTEGMNLITARSEPGKPTGPQLLSTGIGATAKPIQADKTSGGEANLSGALFFDLVAYYRFYQNMIDLIHFNGKYWAEQIVIAPIDISFVLLVIVCGALGAMLRITAMRYSPHLFGLGTGTGAPNAYFFVLGIMCSLIVYILAKTAFAGLTETAYVAKSGNLSPFVTAFLAVVSGLLCEEAFGQIVSAGRAVLSRSTTGKAPTRGRGPTKG